MDRLPNEVDVNPVDVKQSGQMNGITGKILGLMPVFILLLIIFIRIIFVLYKNTGQKARNNQQRRPYIGSRSRNSLPQADPTIYVSPANLTPPPKYEAMAPPSYEEVVGIHYPSFTPTQIQPIAQPIATAMAQNASASSTADVPENRNPGDQTINPPTVITVTNERTVVTASS
ncbi:uncharacterized protein [Battus philenor]|uniref:uncharacterized protein isoform X3 n=1 Tax=Battus philenor TaxID=42288 RepID=UPI0035D0F40B